MSFTNSYRQPQYPSILPESELYGPDPYDLNFSFPVHLDSLRTERVVLTPFIPAIHGRAYWDTISSRPDLFDYYPFICQSYEEVLTFMELKMRADPACILFAVIDKTRPDPTHPEWEGSFAGVIGLFNTSAPNLSSEIAHVLIFPAFQRTHVSGNAVGVLMKYCLDKPTASPPGLGLRRLYWHCHPENAKSAGLAEKMGMKREGILRWHWVLMPVLTKFGKKAGINDIFPEKPGRDTLVLSVCWDEWEDGVQEKVRAIIDKKS